MTTLREAAQQALNALGCLEYSFCGITDGPSEDTTEAAITALKAALAEPVQEPVPLTEEEIINIGKAARAVEGSHILPVTFARAIERAHGIT